MLNLILIRHGETKSNVENRYVGWTDVELNSNGIEQAKNTRLKLKNLPIDVIYSSPLKRTTETTKIINQDIKAKVIFSDELKERNFGVFDNLNLNEIKEQYSDDYQNWCNNWINHKIPQGESAQTNYDRIATFTKQVIETHKSGNVVFVAHLGTIRFILGYLLGDNINSSWYYRVDNCSLSKINITDNFPVLNLLNG